MPLDSNYAVSWDCPRSGGSFNDQLHELDSKERELTGLEEGFTSAGKRIVYKNASGKKSIIHFVTAKQFDLLAHESSSSYVMTAKHCARAVQTKLNGAVKDFKKEIQENQPAEDDTLKTLEKKLEKLKGLSDQVEWTQSAASKSDEVIKDQFEQEREKQKYGFFQRFFKRPKKLDKAKIEQLEKQQKTLQKAKQDAKSKIQEKQKEILVQLTRISGVEDADQLIEKAADYPEVVARAKLAKFQLLCRENPSESKELREVTLLGQELSRMKCFEDAERPLLSREEILEPLTPADNFDGFDTDALNQQFKTFFYSENDGKDFNLKMAESLQKLDMNLEASKFYGKARAISPGEDNASLNQAVLAEHRKIFGHQAQNLEDLNITLSTAIWEIGVAEDFEKAEKAFKKVLENPPNEPASEENASKEAVGNSPQPEVSREKLKPHFQTIASHRKSSEFRKAENLPKRFPEASKRLNFEELKKSHPDLLIDMDGEAFRNTIATIRELRETEKPLPKRYDELRKIVMRKEFREAYIEQSIQVYQDVIPDKVREHKEEELEAMAINFKQLAARSEDFLELLDEALQPLGKKPLLGKSHNNLQMCVDNLAKVLQSNEMQKYAEALTRSSSLLASSAPILNIQEGGPIEQWWTKGSSEADKKKWEGAGLLSSGIGAQIGALAPVRLLRIHLLLLAIQKEASESICFTADPSLGLLPLTTAIQHTAGLANKLNSVVKASEGLILGTELKQVAEKNAINEVAAHAAVIAPVKQAHASSEKAALEVVKVVEAIINTESKLRSQLEDSSPPELKGIDDEVKEWKKRLEAASNQGVELSAVRDVEHAIQRVEGWLGFYRLLESCSAEGADANHIREKFYNEKGAFKSLTSHLKDEDRKAVLQEKLTNRFEKAYAPLVENENRISELKESVTKALQAIGSADRYDLDGLRASIQRWKDEVSALKVDTLEKELEMLTRWEAFCTKLEACTRSEANPLSIFEAAPSKIEADPSKINEEFYGENGLRDQLASFQPDSKRDEYSKNVTHHFEVMFSNFDSSYEKVNPHDYGELVKRKAQLKAYENNLNAPKKKVEKTLAWLNFHIGMHDKTTYKDLATFDAAFPSSLTWLDNLIAGLNEKDGTRVSLSSKIIEKYETRRNDIQLVIDPAFLSNTLKELIQDPEALNKKISATEEQINKYSKAEDKLPEKAQEIKSILAIYRFVERIIDPKEETKTKTIRKKAKEELTKIYPDKKSPEYKELNKVIENAKRKS